MTSSSPQVISTNFTSSSHSFASRSEYLESTQEGSANGDLIVIEPYNNAATQIDRNVSSNNLTLTSSVSGDSVQPNQREYVELEIVNQSPEQAIVANDDQVQDGSSSTEAPASNVNVVYQEANQTAGDNISLADTEPYQDNLEDFDPLKNEEIVVEIHRTNLKNDVIKGRMTRIHTYFRNIIFSDISEILFMCITDSFKLLSCSCAIKTLNLKFLRK